MVKSIISVVVFALCAGGLQAQDSYLVQGTSPDLYLTHTVTKGETLYSLGRAFGLSPKEIAASNNLSAEQGLQLGHTVRIPLTSANFSQKANAGTAAGYHPVVHKVTDKETLYRVSVNHNKVPLENIRQWNNFTGDGLKKDGLLIIGWVKGSGAAAAPAEVATAPAPAVVKETPPVPPVVKEAPAPPPAVVKETPAPAPVVVKETPAPAPVERELAGAPVESPTRPSSGTFEQIYMQQTKNGKDATSEKGPGTWFKSNAAGKYYALHNTAPRGTIVKVTNPLTGKSIYAKVLDVIPQMKQNAGLIVKLSDGAQSALGSNEARFYCELSYEN
jgi:LysM repeat protein